MSLATILDSLSLLLVWPVIKLLTDNNSRAASNIFTKALGTNVLNQEDLKLIVILSLILLAALSALCKIFALKKSQELAESMSVGLSAKSYRNILYSPYSFHLNNNSSAFLSDLVINGNATVLSISFALEILLNSLIAFAIISILIFIGGYVSLAAFLILIIAYILISTYSRRILGNSGFTIAKMNKSNIQFLQESIGAIRDIIVDNSQEFFIQQYISLTGTMRRAQFQSKFTQSFPKYLLDGLGLVLILILIIISLSLNYENDMLALIATLALGLQKLIPTFHKIYANWANIRSRTASVNSFLETIEIKIPEGDTSNLKPVINLLNFKQLDAVNIAFGYNQEKTIFDKVNFQVIKGDKIAVIGTSGAGKSSLLDLLLLLQNPTKGNLILHSEMTATVPLIEASRSWKNMIAHVPQKPFIFDNNIIYNICFDSYLKGIPIDHNLLKKVAYVCVIEDLVMAELQKEKPVSLGENGSNLSGGQKQRIAFARSLYKNPQLLVTDEATSALDQATEDLLLSRLKEQYSSVTMISITHRLNTLKHYNKVFKLESGSLSLI